MPAQVRTSAAAATWNATTKPRRVLHGPAIGSNQRTQEPMIGLDAQPSTEAPFLLKWACLTADQVSSQSVDLGSVGRESPSPQTSATAAVETRVGLLGP